MSSGRSQDGANGSTAAGGPPNDTTLGPQGTFAEADPLDVVEVDKRLRRLRKRSLFDALPPIAHDVEAIKRIIPHRPPLLFVDKVIGLDVASGCIEGRRDLDPTDPVFSGHFPDYPLYPGSFEIEMVGQLGLCLYHFVKTGGTDIPADAEPVAMRATRVLGAYYLEPVRPGDQVRLLAQAIAFDGFLAQMIGQVMIGDKVSCVTAGEVVILDE